MTAESCDGEHRLLPPAKTCNGKERGQKRREVVKSEAVGEDGKNKNDCIYCEAVMPVGLAPLELQRWLCRGMSLLVDPLVSLGTSTNPAGSSRWLSLSIYPALLVNLQPTLS